ncbi:LysE family translocator [Persephonella sp.]
MNFLQDFVAGITLGVAAGLSPGPLMALLISETVKGHRKNGILVSLSPVITDIPILLVFLYLLEKVKEIEGLISLISLCGSFVLFYFGYKNITLRSVQIETDITGSLKKGVLLNILNPYTYIFWFFIGAPYVANAGFLGGIVFTVSFFAGITGSMIVIAIFIDRLKKFFQSKYYLYLLRFIGVLFFILGFVLLKDSIKQFI